MNHQAHDHCASNTVHHAHAVDATPASHHAHHHADAGPWRLAASATLHCLTGCAIGEAIGLAIGVTLGLPTAATIVLATVLAYASGFSLGLWPLVRRGERFASALRAIWLGEAISIAAMEVAMNTADYAMGGMGASSIFDPMFWRGFLVALPVGFLVAWPVNAWLLRRRIKAHCH